MWKKECSMTKFWTTCHCAYYWGTWGLQIDRKHFWRRTDKVKSVRHTHGQVPHCGSQGEVWTNREQSHSSSSPNTARWASTEQTLGAEWILVSMKVLKKWQKKKKNMTGHSSVRQLRAVISIWNSIIHCAACSDPLCYCCNTSLLYRVSLDINTLSNLLALW